MVLPKKHDAIWCPNCDWTGTQGRLERVDTEDRIGRTVTVLACPDCGIRLDTES